MISTVHHPNTILTGRSLRGWYPLCTIQTLSWQDDPKEDEIHCAKSKHYPDRTILKRMISTVHHPKTILTGRSLRRWYPPCTIQTLSWQDDPYEDDIHCAASKHYPDRTILKRMISTVHHPNTILTGRSLRGWYPLCTIQTLSWQDDPLEDDIHCAPSKHYPDRTILKRMISTVHHPNTILTGRSLRGWYPLCTIQTLSWQDDP